MPAAFPVQKFAKLLHQLSGHQPEQKLVLTSEVCHREILVLIGEEACRAGVVHLSAHYEDWHFDRMNVQHATAPDYVPESARAVLNRDIVREGGVYVRVWGMENPLSLQGSGVDTQRRSAFYAAHWRAAKSYYRAIDQGLVQYVIAAAPTPGWASQIFPELPPAAAFARLSSLLERIYRLDHEDPYQAWQAHGKQLLAKARKFNKLALAELHFKGGETDLTVGLTRKSAFAGGPEIARNGKDYWPNVPTEEVYTTPDWRTVRGQVACTANVIIDGGIVRRPRFLFVKGSVVEVQAEAGVETVRHYCARHPTLRRMGEIALVSGDAVTAQSDVLFYDSLFDENRGCHFALGGGYPTAIKGGPLMSRSELRALGVNISDEGHDDFVFGTEDLNVDGVDRFGRTHVLMRSGLWVD